MYYSDLFFLCAHIILVIIIAIKINLKYLCLPDCHCRKTQVHFSLTFSKTSFQFYHQLTPKEKACISPNIYITPADTICSVIKALFINSAYQ
jgi:hypothetical protein